MSRRTRQLALRGAVAVLVAAGAVACWFLLADSGGDPGMVVIPLHGDLGVTVSEEEGVDTSWLDRFSTPRSPPFDVSSDARGPYELHFPLPEQSSGASQNLVAASTTTEPGAWSLYRGRIEADEIVFKVPHLSIWQLRELKFENPLPSFDDFERQAGARASSPSCGQPVRGLWLRRVDRDGILVGPCSEVRRGQAVLRVANGRATAQVIETSERAAVTVRGRSLPEAIDDAVYRIAPGRELRLFPGTGEAAISFGSLPAKANFEATQGAAVLELALLVATRGRDRAAPDQVLPAMECMWGLYDELEFSYRSPQALEDALQLVFGACGDTIGDAFSVQALSSAGFLLGAPKVLYGLWDTGRSFLDAKASIELSATGPGHRPVKAGPETGGRGDTCGHLEGIYPATGTAVAVEVGLLEGEVPCADARRAVLDYIAGTGACDQTGAGTCWRAKGGWECVAPTAGSYPISVSCWSGDVRVAALSSDVLPLAKPEPCGTAPGTKIPGPFDVESNFRCDAARAIADTWPDEGQITPFVCDFEPLGIESARTTCRFGSSEVRFITGA